MSAITKSAKGEDCQVRIPNVCIFNPETTVFAHKNGGGIGKKSSDIHGAYACSACHKYIDRHYDHETLVFFYEGIMRTQLILMNKGLIKST